MNLIFALSLLMISALFAQVAVTEVVSLPTATTYGGGDVLGSQLIGRTYNAGNGPGIWIVADGGYRLYLNGELLAEDNQAGRVTFVPMTFLPGENAVSVVGLDGNGAPGVLVQIDELEKSYYSGSDWYSKPSVSNTAWKAKGRDLSQWGHAMIYGSASTMPSGTALSGFATNSESQWIWTDKTTDTLAVLLFTFNIKAEGFGAGTTGGDGGIIVVASDSASIRKALQDNVTKTILIPEGTYDFRLFRNAVTEATAAGYTWCKSSCGSNDSLSSNTFYRIAFAANNCSSLGSGLTIVTENDNLQRWDNWITTKPNKSLIGMGRGANLRGASLFMRSYEGGENEIFRNLGIYDVNPSLVEAGDGLSAVGSSSDHTSKLWADHISYKWISDGLDITYTDSVTVSWLDYDGANQHNCWATDPYMALVEDASVTYANDYWHNTYGRVPKAAGQSAVTKIHVYNNYVDYNRFFIAGASGKSSSAYAQILYENSYINRAVGYYTYKEDYGYIHWTGNTVTNSTASYRTGSTTSSTTPTDNVFTPAYTYLKKTVSTLPTEIPNNAGVGGRWGFMPDTTLAFGQSNKAPSVSLTATVSSSSSGSISFTATASDADGTIASVDFYVGTTKVGSASSSPYSFTLSGFSEGTYSLIAKATDNSGLVGSSSYLTVTVTASTGINATQKFGATEAEASFYRIFDVQGHPLYVGEQMPNRLPASSAIVVEYGPRGQVLNSKIVTRR